jgi:hypothetical protein
MNAKSFALAALICLSCTLSYSRPLMIPASDSSNHYTDTTIRGWKVYVNSTLDRHPSVVANAYSVLNDELDTIEARLPASAVTELKTVPIWFEYYTRNDKILHYYFESADKLSEKNLDPRKEGSIEAQMEDYVNMPHDSVPLVKWFAYAYHQQVLGPHNMEIIRAFQHAKASGAYETQMYNREYFPLANARDYFAILSAAYFAGKLSYAPFNKENLKKLDPQGYALIEKMWKVKG